jgi:hypothetical protein
MIGASAFGVIFLNLEEFGRQLQFKKEKKTEKLKLQKKEELQKWKNGNVTNLAIWRKLN